MSEGGNSCNGRCDPDECHDRIDCPGNGYWCKDAGKDTILPIKY